MAETLRVTVLISLLTALLQLSSVRANYRFEVRAYAYSNPNGALRSGFCCDTRWSETTSHHRPPGCDRRYAACDTGFTFCLRNLGTLQDGNSVNCPLGRFETQQSVGEDYITFSVPYIENPNVPNPLTYTGLTWTGGFQMLVEVEDRDSRTNDQLIDDIYIEELITPGQTPHQRSYGGYFNVATITLSFNLTCTGMYRGPNCTHWDLCQPLANPVNGRVQQPSSIVEGSIAVYSCDTGYAVDGVSSRTCRSGLWTNSAPTCESVHIDCGPPSRPLNGGTSFTSTTFQSQLTYSCVSGYSLQGPYSRICQSDGRWSGYDPICIVDCSHLEDPPNGHVSVTGGSLGAIATYTCSTGYTLFGESSQTCLQTGQWSSTPPTCNAVDCGPPASFLTNGRTHFTHTTFQSQVSYSCASGYSLQGHSTRTCQSDGTWSGLAPICIIACSVLDDLLNGQVSVTSRTLNAVAMYTCNTGYILSGDSTRTCLATGQWSSTPPTCNVVDCGHPSRPENGGTSFMSTTFQSQVAYSCVSGYSLQGPSTRTCQSDGRWSEHDPVCTLDCAVLQDPLNGHVSITGLSLGATAMYTCNTGYTLSGDSSQTCLETGQWSSSYPTCKVVECGPPSRPLNGGISFTSTTFQSQVTYSCVSGYFLQGPSTRTCQSDGSWSQHDPVCGTTDKDEATTIANSDDVDTGSAFHKLGEKILIGIGIISFTIIVSVLAIILCVYLLKSMGKRSERRVHVDTGLELKNSTNSNKKSSLNFHFDRSRS